MFALWLLQSVLIPPPPQREANFSIFFHFLPLTSPPPLSLPPFSSSIITFLSQQISYSKSLKKKAISMIDQIKNTVTANW